MFDDVAFWTCAAVAVASGYGVFAVNSMARATYLLAVSFIAVAAGLLTLQLAYLGIVSVLMMVMEMAIMAVFMIAFMMNPGGLMPMSMMHNKMGALAISAGTFVTLAVGSFAVPWPDRVGQPPHAITFQLGMGIMGDKALVMVTVGALLFATMVAVVTLAAPRTRYDRYGDDLDRGPADPVPGGVGR